MTGTIPLFAVEEVHRVGDDLRLRGRGSRRDWIAEGGVVYLGVGPDVWLEGFLRDVSRWRRHATLVLPRSGARTDLVAGRSYPYLDSYWGDRAVVVLDASRRWHETDFVPRRPWDHDHCWICWAVISDRVNTRHRTSDDGKVVCLPCHERFILGRSLDFVERV